MADVTAATAPDSEVSRWKRRLAGCVLPVCTSTGHRIAELSKRTDSITPREVSAVVQRDPLFALHVLRYLGGRRGRRQVTEITTVEHGIMMLGVGPFFAAFGELTTVEQLLGARPQALAGFGRVLARSRLAARFSRVWGQLRLDIETDEVLIAALLHDLAELLLWCFDPDSAEEVARRLRASPGLRSADAQQQVLGFRLLDLQLDLAREWTLPGLLVELMDDAQASRPRVRSVALSVALARHAVNGWRDPALADDYREAAALLRMPEPEIRSRARAVALEALAEQDSAEPHERALAFPGVVADGAIGELDVARDVAAWQRAAAMPAASQILRRAALLGCAATVFSALFGTGAVRRAVFLGVASGATEVRIYESECVPFPIPLAPGEARMLLDLGRQDPAWLHCTEADPLLPRAVRRLLDEPSLSLLPLPVTAGREGGVFIVAGADFESGGLSEIPAWLAAGAERNRET